MSRKGPLLRLGVLVLLIVSAFTGLGARLAWLHLGDHSELRAKYSKQRVYERNFKGARGRIHDRNGRILALDLGMKHVGVDPSFAAKHSDPLKIADALSQTLQMERADILSRLGRDELKYQLIKKYVHQDKANEIADLKLKGVVLDDVTARHYPLGSLMCHVVGFSNVEGKGSMGVELTMNSKLCGKEGLRISKKDGGRREMYNRRSVEIAPTPGANVYLTLDQNLQYMMERSLKAGIEEMGAKAGWAMLMDVKTGDVLAMSSMPDFDLNRYGQATDAAKRNRCIHETYEPGSIMKCLTFAAALNEKIINPNAMIDCEGGVWYYRGRPLRDFHGYGLLTIADALKKSSNIAASKIGLMMGAERMERYFRAFGIGRSTGVGLPGEEHGIFAPRSRWDGLTLSRIPMGHAVSVTTIQMCAAINAIANGGKLMRPRYIDRVEDTDGQILLATRPEGVRQVIRPEVARLTRQLMARICEKGGTGRRAAIPGYRVAGKTGTAEKIINGKYSHRENISSFVGFLPAEDPVFTLIVGLDTPTTRRTGGGAAAPIFKTIAEDAIRYLSILPVEETGATGS